MTAEEIYQKIENIPGWFSEEDIKGFMSLDLPKYPFIIECGTYCGRSAAAFTYIWPQCKVLTCDPVDEPLRVSLHINVSFLHRRGVDIHLPDGDLVDIIFIDDSHYYDDIKANFDHLLPMLKSGGYVVFHDYHFPHDEVDGVRRFVDELGGCDTSNVGEYGLAIWRKP